MRRRNRGQGREEAAAAGLVLLSELAYGGMGYVELVERREGRLRRLYVRKRLYPFQRGNPAARTMFMDEARLAGLVRHPNVVGVLAIGEDGDGPYLLMEYLEGVDLAALIEDASQRGVTLPVQLCARVALDVARGLHAAHELRGPDGSFLGLVHRDVTPKNILLGFDGSVKVTDFGIAKALGNEAHTERGTVKGNIGYLAPEQIRGEPIDRRVDLFALGVVLFELLAGRKLYPASAIGSSLERILREPTPDIGHERGDVPPELVELLFELMAKDRDARPGAAGEVALRLEEIVAALVTQEGPLDVARFLTKHFPALQSRHAARVAAPADHTRAAPKRWKAPVFAAAALVAAVVAGAAFVALRAPGARPESVWAGGWHTCARRGERLFCWGKNNEGQLATGARIDRVTPTAVESLDRVRSIGAGQFHTCACLESGEVSCWGRNVEGQLGTGDAAGRVRPQRVPGVSGCVEVTAGSRHTCARRRDGQVWCWGDDREGQTGQPPTSSTPPALVPTLGAVDQISARGDFTCARRAGAVHCWGTNRDGQLGGAGPSRSAPAPVPGVSDAVEVSAGHLLACARTAAGHVLCWGHAGSGMGPTGSASPERRVATDVQVPSAAVGVAAGFAHACAIDASGHLACWGANHFGQLGRGFTSDVERRPAAVPLDARAFTIAAGLGHTCAATVSGLVCFGNNETGQLGDGTHDDRLTPVSVAGFAGAASAQAP